MSITNIPETTVVSQDDQIAMEWISQNTSIIDRFIVLTGIKDWYIDNISEWFPALAGRTSIATIQGIEWLPRDNSYHPRYIDLQNCSNNDVSCLSAWAKEYDESFLYIYLHKPNEEESIINLPISFSLGSSDQFQLVFDNSRASVYRVKNGP
jgi:hypothetical protein